MSERLSFSALGDNFDNSESDELPEDSNSANATLRRQEQEIQKLRKANFNLKLQVFNLEERLGVLSNSFEGDSINKSSISFEDSGSQTPKSSLVHVLQEKEKEVAQRDELLKKARKVIFSLQEKIKELYENRHSALFSAEEQTYKSKENSNVCEQTNGEVLPRRLRENIETLRQRWNSLAETFPSIFSKIEEDHAVCEEFSGLENTIRQVAEAIPAFQNTLNDSNRLLQHYSKQGNKRIASGSWIDNEASQGEYNYSAVDIGGYTDTDESDTTPLAENSGMTQSQNDFIYVERKNLADGLVGICNLLEIEFSRTFLEGNNANNDILNYLNVVFERTASLREEYFRLQQELEQQEEQTNEAIKLRYAAEESVELYRAEIERISNELVSLKQLYEEEKTEIGDYWTRLEETSKYDNEDKERILSELQTNKQKLEELTERYGRQKEELERHKFELEQVTRAYEMEKAKSLEDLQHRKDQLQETAESQRIEKEKLTEQLEIARSQLLEIERQHQNEKRTLLCEIEYSKKAQSENKQRYEEEKEKAYYFKAQLGNAYSMVSTQIQLTKDQLEELRQIYKKEKHLYVEELETIKCKLHDLRDVPQHCNELYRRVDEFETWVNVLTQDDEHRFVIGKPVSCTVRDSVLQDLYQLNQKIYAYESELDQVNQKYTCLEEEKRQMEEYLEQNETEIDIYREELETLRKQAQNLATEHEELNFQNSSLKQQLQLLVRELERTRNDLKEKKEKLEALSLEKERATKESESLRLANKQLTDELATLSNANDNMDDSVKNIQKTIDEKEAEIASLHQSLSSLERVATEGNEDVVHLKQVRDELLDTLKLKTEELDNMTARYQEQCEKLNKSHIKISQQEAQLESLKLEIKEKEEERARTSLELEQYMHEKEVVQQRLKDYEEKISTMNDELQHRRNKQLHDEEELMALYEQLHQAKIEIQEKKSTIERLNVSLESAMYKQFDHKCPQAKAIMSDDQQTIDNAASSTTYTQKNMNSESVVSFEGSMNAEKNIKSHPEQETEEDNLLRHENKIQVANSLSPQEQLKELRLIVQQRDYENCALQQESESYFVQWKNIEQVNEKLLAMVHILEEEQFETKKVMQQVKSLLENIVHSKNVDPKATMKSLCFCLELFWVLDREGQPLPPKGESNVHLTYEDTATASNLSRQCQSSVTISDKTETADNSQKGRDSDCGQVLTSFSDALESLQEASRQLYSMLPKDVTKHIKEVNVSLQPLNVVIVDEKFHLEELTSYISQLAKLLVHFKEVIYASMFVLQSQLSGELQENISVYEIAQSAFGPNNSSYGYKHPEASFLCDESWLNETSKDAIGEAETKLSILQSITGTSGCQGPPLPPESINIIYQLQNTMLTFENHVEQLLYSLTERLLVLSNKQKLLMRPTDRRGSHYGTTPGRVGPMWPHERQGKSSFLSSSKLSGMCSWEEMVFRQIEETQKVINKAHQNLSWEKHRLIRSVFGENQT